MPSRLAGVPNMETSFEFLWRLNHLPDGLVRGYNTTSISVRVLIINRHLASSWDVDDDCSLYSASFVRILGQAEVGESAGPRTRITTTKGVKGDSHLVIQHISLEFQHRRPSQRDKTGKISVGIFLLVDVMTATIRQYFPVRLRLPCTWCVSTMAHYRSDMSHTFEFRRAA